jgi:hypothetical protein
MYVLLTPFLFFFQREVQSIKAFVSHPTQIYHPPLPLLLLLPTILLAFIPLTYALHNTRG